MPSWGIHLAVANDAVKTLKLEDENAFLFGNVLPDLLCGYVVEDISKVLLYDETHFCDVAGLGNKSPALPNYSELLKKYGKKDNSIFIGYYLHLLTDYHWNTYAIKKLDGLNPRDYDKGEYLTLNRMKQLDFNTFDKSLCSVNSFITPVYSDYIYKYTKELLPATEQDCKNGIATLYNIANPTYIPNRDY